MSITHNRDETDHQSEMKLILQKRGERHVANASRKLWEVCLLL